MAKGYGFANLEHQAPVTTHSIFQSGSVGKQFSAAVIVHLEEHGRLRLDDIIARYLLLMRARWRIDDRGSAMVMQHVGKYPSMNRRLIGVVIIPKDRPRNAWTNRGLD